MGLKNLSYIIFTKLLVLPFTAVGAQCVAESAWDRCWPHRKYPPCCHWAIHQDFWQRDNSKDWSGSFPTSGMLRRSWLARFQRENKDIQLTGSPSRPHCTTTCASDSKRSIWRQYQQKIHWLIRVKFINHEFWNKHSFGLFVVCHLYTISMF